LSGIDVPVLVIQGVDDQYGTRAQVDAIVRQVSAPVELVMLEDCKHSPHLERTQATIEAIGKFVARTTCPAQQAEGPKR
jgi:predicted alpha/beta-hydrolase family hydrolase